MKLNRSYERPSELPQTIPVFPLAEALLLPRRPLPLSIFEPRYLAMIDDALSGERLIGMIQPSDGEEASDKWPELCAIGCVGRITQFAETGDGRCFVTLTGIARFRVIGEAPASTLYRQARIDFSEFSNDFREGEGENAVDRPGLLTALRKFAEARKFKIDWDDIQKASNEALVNGLSMLSPYGAKEKQALLEASDLKARADMLVAITQMELARSEHASPQIH
ncbi:LON peptidase substrate-binding domain-containing protein [Methylocapsa sp. S129]|uniref:LON peptidase substrate-binding domain-containing protein n=1 Tax=Methylocapsa sp. S129 TaxID=1641869 RepID=UPI00131C6756|nr:LON peptidase substrate-binding domain-containing protein [Methylocapsa sp. S129]